MKGLDTLIKLQKRNLDGLRRKMVNLEDQKESMMQLSAKLHNDLAKERELAAGNPQMAAYLVEFSKRIQARQVEITKEILNLDQEISKVSVQISEVFGELKKFEIAKDKQLEREAEAQKRLETQLLDEVGGQQHARKNSDDA